MKNAITVLFMMVSLAGYSDASQGTQTEQQLQTLIERSIKAEDYGVALTAMKTTGS